MRRPLLHGTTKFSTGKQPGKAMTLALCYDRILNIFLTALQGMNQTVARSPGRRKVRARRRRKKLCGVRNADPCLVAKQCYHCQGLGHVQADCPTLRISGAGTIGRCYSCGQPGHLAVGISCYL